MFSEYQLGLLIFQINFSLFWSVLSSSIISSVKFFAHDCNWTRTQNHLARKRTLNYLVSLAKWLSVRLLTKWLWVRVQLQSVKFQISRLLRARRSLTFRKLLSVDLLWKRVRVMTRTCSSLPMFFLFSQYMSAFLDASNLVLCYFHLRQIIVDSNLGVIWQPVAQA